MIDSCTKTSNSWEDLQIWTQNENKKCLQIFCWGGFKKKNWKRNVSLRKCVSFLFDFLVVANKTWCFFLCVVCCLNIWMYFTAVGICQRYHISCFLFLFVFLFSWIVTSFFGGTANELWIWYYAYFHVSIVYKKKYCYFPAEFTVNYELCSLLDASLSFLSLCTRPHVHPSDCCWWINYVPVMWS